LPEFAETFVAMGAIKGGWEELENKLDLTNADNRKLNKLAWCHHALQLMDMIADKNAYEMWQHLKSKYEQEMTRHMQTWRLSIQRVNWRHQMRTLRDGLMS